MGMRTTSALKRSRILANINMETESKQNQDHYFKHANTFHILVVEIQAGPEWKLEELSKYTKL